MSDPTAPEQVEKDQRHWAGILSGEITRACLKNGMGARDAAETAAVVMVKVIEEQGWTIIPPSSDVCPACSAVAGWREGPKGLCLTCHLDLRSQPSSTGVTDD